MNKAQRIERIGMIVRCRENGLVSTVVPLISILNQDHCY
jgi:hypothetical protein